MTESQVVERSSALLGIPLEISIPLDGDHRNICRFTDIRAKRFSSIKTRLEDMVRMSNPSNAKKAEKSFLQSLNPSDYKAHKNRNPESINGTCTWILDHPVYTSWIEFPGPSLLWISADPGCGKSVLASFLIDRISQLSEAFSRNVCYFFFKSDNIQQSSVINGLKSLLYQLYNQQSDLTTKGMILLQGEDLNNMDCLWQALMRSTECEDAKSTICILDGLDECTPDLRACLMDRISRSFSLLTAGDPTILQRTRAPQTSATPESGVNPTVFAKSKLKILITSRPDNQIKVAFQKHAQREIGSLEDFPAHCPIFRLRMEDETVVISSDVTKVIKAKVDGLIRLGFPVAILEDIQAQLIYRADRTFLWVSLILELMEQKLEVGASLHELVKLLKNRDIYHVYSQLLAFSVDTPRARKMLQLVLAATRAMTVHELSVALAVEPEDDVPGAGRANLADVEVHLAYPRENHIKSLCGHFIRVVRNEVYLVHETAREFLLKENSVGGASFSAPARTILPDVTVPGLGLSSSVDMPDRCSFQHSFSLVEARALLLKVCATYLYCLGRSEYTERRRVSRETQPFLGYAARNWVAHFHKVVEDGGELNLPYHQNLCHPFFPGFELWTRSFWYPDLPPVPPGDADEVHDVYLNFFGLSDEHIYPGSDGDKYSSEDYESDEDDEDDMEIFRETSSRPYDIKKKGDNAPYDRSGTASFSTNPTSLSNRYFPLQVDSSGFVSLDFSGKLGPRYRETTTGRRRGTSSPGGSRAARGTSAPGGSRATRGTSASGGPPR